MFLMFDLEVHHFIMANQVLVPVSAVEITTNSFAMTFLAGASNETTDNIAKSVADSFAVGADYTSNYEQCNYEYERTHVDNSKNLVDDAHSR
uniref:Uncharacterized protein n=1 Tax=Bursaphelenchus xylophilus TaxID=6326 RepID=A0A1I7RMN1_BURXY